MVAHDLVQWIGELLIDLPASGNEEHPINRADVGSAQEARAIDAAAKVLATAQGPMKCKELSEGDADNHLIIKGGGNQAPPKYAMVLRIS